MPLMLRIESPSCPWPSALFRSIIVFGAALFLLVFCASMSIAHDATPRPGAPATVTNVQSAADPHCFCWSDGKKIAEGLTACIRTANGRRLAECGRVINLMSWQISDEICPES